MRRMELIGKTILKPRSRLAIVAGSYPEGRTRRNTLALNPLSQKMREERKTVFPLKEWRS
jgi:hypothetical protein